MSVKQYIPAIKYGNLVAGDEIEAGAITGSNLVTGKGFFSVTAATNGTSAVSVFGASGIPTNAIITNVTLTSQDTTAGNITVENPASTVVATIAKGTASGAVVGAATLANTSYVSGTNLIVKSSTAGNALVVITFTI